MAASLRVILTSFQMNWLQAVDVICLRGAPLQLVEELGSGSADEDEDEDPEFLHERILRFRIPGASSCLRSLMGFWRPKPGAPGESARSRDTAFAIRDMMITRTFERAGICVDPASQVHRASNENDCSPANHGREAGVPEAEGWRHLPPDAGVA